MQQKGQEVVVKKYSNRRLYDTSESRYITLDELAAKIRTGRDVRVIDAKSNADLTQATLAQIILESRRAARLLPVPLLTQLIRMGDDALAEFFSKYMSFALELYVQARQGAQAMAPFNPFTAVPLAASSALSRFFTGTKATGGTHEDAAPHHNGAHSVTPPSAANRDAPPSEIDDLKKKVETLEKVILSKSDVS
ncbi:MAG: polyhydroxyalkanoate synthesis regulator DNA-binding domain-containing protein [Myxococcota bacterium]